MDAVSRFVGDLREQGISLWLQDDRVHYRAPRGVFSERHAAQLREWMPQLLEYLRSAGMEQNGELELRAGSLEGVLPVTTVQEAFISYYEKLASPAVQASWFDGRLEGDLDIVAMKESFSFIVGRHSVLRTRYQSSADGKPCATVNPVNEFDLEYSDFTDRLRDRLDQDIAAAIQASVDRRFDLGKGPLLRVLLLKLAPNEHVITVTVHHSVCDAWSIGLLMREVQTAYAAFSRSKQPELPALEFQYADYARWQRGSMGSAEDMRQFAHCVRRLEGVKQPFYLPPEPALALSAKGRGTRTSFDVSAQSVHGLRSLAQRAEDTLPTVVLAALAVLLARWRGSPDVLVKSVHHGRDRAEFGNLVGCFASNIIIRVNLDGATTFLEVLERVRVARQDAHEHSRIGWWRLRPELERIAGESRILDIHFNFRPRGLVGSQTVQREAPSGSLVLRDLQLKVPVTPPSSPDSLDELTGMLLNISVVEGDSGLAGRVRYVGGRFHASTIDAFCRGFADLLENVARSQGNVAVGPFTTS